MEHPPRPASNQQAGGKRQRHAQPPDRDQDHEPQLGPAVGVLVEAQAEEGRREDHGGQPEEQERARELEAGAAGGGKVERDDERPARTATITRSKKPRRAYSA